MNTELSTNAASGSQKMLEINNNSTSNNSTSNSEQHTVSQVNDTANSQASSQESTHERRDEPITNNAQDTGKEWGNSNQWIYSQWQGFGKLIEGISGEKIMKTLKLKRRKDLEHLVYKLSLRENKLLEIQWDFNKDEGERALPELKVGKDCLRLSQVRLTHLFGFPVPEQTYVDVEKLSESELKMKFYFANQA